MGHRGRDSFVAMGLGICLVLLFFVLLQTRVTDYSMHIQQIRRKVGDALAVFSWTGLKAKDEDLNGLSVLHIASNSTWTPSEAGTAADIGSSKLMGAYSFNTTNSYTLPRKVTKVLLVTYYRGGSSFLGQLFNQNAEAFYWFEPLRAVNKQNSGIDKENNTTVSAFMVGNGEIKLMDANSQYIVADTLNNLLHCQLNSVQDDILRDPFVKRTVKSQHYRACMAGEHGPSRAGDSRFDSCVPLLNSACSTSKIAAIKVIRVPLNLVKYLWQLDPDVFVIYYTRDPRGMLLSRNLINLGDITEDAKTTCARMLDELELSHSYQSTHSERFMELRYEDLALDANITAQRVYNFLGLKIPQNTLHWLELNTHRPDKHNATYGTTRDSMLAMRKWRTSIKKDVKVKIDDICKAVIRRLGYHF